MAKAPEEDYLGGDPGLPLRLPERYQDSYEAPNGVVAMLLRHNKAVGVALGGVLLTAAGAFVGMEVSKRVRPNPRLA